MESPTQGTCLSSFKSARLVWLSFSTICYNAFSIAWWKEHEKRADLSRPLLTVSDLMQYYILAEKPIEGRTLFALLEPLAGTSFMRTAIQRLQLHVAERRRQPDTHIYPHDVYLFFWGTRYPDQVRTITNSQRIRDATLAVHSLSTRAIGIDKVSILNWLQNPGEMMLAQGRWDKVYHDPERTQEAFSHHSGQWQFYTGGSHIHTIAESRISYQDDAGAFQQYALFPDGYFDTSFFIDGRRRPFTAFPAQQQEFTKGYRMLFISPHFSFDQARKT